jgi:hypothetical protein
LWTTVAEAAALRLVKPARRVRVITPEQRERRRRAHHENRESEAARKKAFYAALTPEQKAERWKKWRAAHPITPEKRARRSAKALALSRLKLYGAAEYLRGPK